jgi:aspartate/tyrosine/aromatic aminotransferase
LKACARTTRAFERQPKRFIPAVAAGLPAFNAAAANFALGPNSAARAEGRVASLQTLSGTGSLRVCGTRLPGPVYSTAAVRRALCAMFRRHAS